MESFVFENVEMRIVQRESIDGRTFFVSRDGSKGCNIMPNGSLKNCNATPVTCQNSKYNGRRKQHYLQFKDVFGHHRPILAAHAVWLAWSEKPLPPNHQIHHLTGIITDNCLDNLLCLASKSEHPIADTRQRALRKLFPNLDSLPYNYLRHWQDPRDTSDEEFQSELARITERVRILESVFTVVHHWQTFTPEDYMRFFAMPLDEFKALWAKPKSAIDPDDFDLLHRQKEII